MRASRFRGTAGDRRRLVALGATALIIGAIFGTNMLSAFASNAPSRPLDRDLSSYVLFAFDTLDFKGGTISGGDVGANGIDANPARQQPRAQHLCQPRRDDGRRKSTRRRLDEGHR